MKEHTYQLNVELQVHSANEDARSVESDFLAGLSTWLHNNAPWATVSAIKCAETHKFDEWRWGPGSAIIPEVATAIEAVRRLVEADFDGGFGEFDAPAEVLVRAKWPNVTDWECRQVTYSEGVVTLHDLYVKE